MTNSDTILGQPYRNGDHFLVLGSATLETVIHSHDQRRRVQTGGVAAQIATALASQARRTTIMATVGDDRNGSTIRDLLARSNVNLTSLHTNTESGHSTIVTHQGEHLSAKGHWPKYNVASILTHSITKDITGILIDTNATPAAISDALTTANEMAVPSLVTAATKRGALHILQAGPVLRTAVTMNHRECNAIMNHTGVSLETELLDHLHTQFLLITNGDQGWTLHHREAQIHSPAPTPPSDTDFIGCGDYAAAGLMISIVDNIDPTEIINHLISLRMELNRLPPHASNLPIDRLTSLHVCQKEVGQPSPQRQDSRRDRQARGTSRRQTKPRTDRNTGPS